MIDPLLLEMLANAVENNDCNEAAAAASLILRYKDPGDELRITVVHTDLARWVDDDGLPTAVGVATHALLYRDREICRWRRRSRAEIGLDRNNPQIFSAIATDDPRSRYVTTVESALEVLGLVDHAPAIPDPQISTAEPEPSLSADRQLPLDLGN